MSDHCNKCGGLIMEPGRNYLYSGKVCHCVRPSRYADNGLATYGEVDTLRARLAKAEAERDDWKREGERERSAMLGWMRSCDQAIKARDAAQAECEEQARLNGMGASREAKLMAEVERLKADNATLHEQVTENWKMRDEALEECATLRMLDGQLREEIANLKAPLLPTQISRYRLRQENELYRAQVEGLREDYQRALNEMFELRNNHKHQLHECSVRLAQAEAECDSLRRAHSVQKSLAKALEHQRDHWEERFTKLDISRAACCEQMEQERDTARAQAAAMKSIVESMRQEYLEVPQSARRSLSDKEERLFDSLTRSDSRALETVREAQSALQVCGCSEGCLVCDQHEDALNKLNEVFGYKP